MNKKLISDVILHIVVLIILYLFIIVILSGDRLKTQDISLYYEYCQKIMSGQIPYYDFNLEYPPLALFPIIFPYLCTFLHPVNFPVYVHLFPLQNMVYSVLIMLLIVRIIGNKKPPELISKTLTGYTLLIISTSPFLFLRYDIFPAVLSIAGFYYFIHEKPVLSGVMTGLSVAAKLYAIFLVPVYLVFLIVMKDWKSIFRYLLSIAITILIVSLPLLTTEVDQISSFFHYHYERGIQVESLPGGLIILSSALGIAQATINYSYGAWHVSSLPLSAVLLKVIPVVFLIFFIAIISLSYRNFHDSYLHETDDKNKTLLISLYAILVCFIIFNKVFSPQYLIWILPFAVFLNRSHVLLLMCINCLTLFLNVDYVYIPLLNHALYAAILLNIRNMAILFILWRLLRGLSVKNASILNT